jgi:hypothetical protein
MDTQIKKQKLTKQGGATIQVEAAIDALKAENFAAAVTLAGAAEGMIEGDDSDVFNALLAAPGVAKEDQKKWISTLNGERLA